MQVYKHVHDVQYAHCDPTGVVFLPRYFELIHAVIENWFDEALDWPVSRLIGTQGLSITFRNIAADFPHPGRLGDRMTWRLQVTSMGTTSMGLSLRATSRSGGEVYVRCTGTLVLSEAVVMRSRAWPDTLRERAQEFLVVPQDDLQDT